MRTIDANILTQLEANALIPFLLFEMNIDSTDYRYTSCDVPLVVNGDRYEPRYFTIPDVQYSQDTIVDSLTIEFTHLDDTQDQDEVSSLTSIFIGGTPQDEVAIVSLVVLDPTDFTVEGDTSFTLFKGNIDEWGIIEDTISVTIMGILDQWSQRTLNQHPPSCRWKIFKGTECGYAGAETECDRSYARCDELSNTDNFGGFRWLPSIQNKSIWWGTNILSTGSLSGSYGGGGVAGGDGGRAKKYQ